MSYFNNTVPGDALRKIAEVKEKYLGTNAKVETITH